MERGEEEPTDSANSGAAAPAGAHGEAGAKARAYLDLWERHVVLTALHGPAAPWRPAKS